MGLIILCVLVLLPSVTWADLSWWLAPYDRKDHAGQYGRVCAMNRYTPTIYGEGGQWSEIETLGNRCLVKVRSSAATIAVLATDPDFQRMPKDALTLSLADLTALQKTQLKNLVLGLGFTIAEVQAQFPNDLGTYTLGDVLRFVISRRIRPRYDPPTDNLVFDGPVIGQQRNLDDADGDVQ